MTEYIANRLLAVTYTASTSVLAAYDTTDMSLLPQLDAALDVPHSLSAVVVSPTGTHLALCWSGAPGVTLLDSAGVSTGFASGLVVGAVHAAFSPDGSRLAVVYNDSPYLKVYDVATGGVVWSPSTSIPTGAQCVAFSPDGSLLVAGHEATERLTAWNTETWTKSGVLDTINRPGGAPLPRAIAFSPDGGLLAVGHVNAPCLTVYTTVPAPTRWSKVTAFTTDNGGLGTFNGFAVAFSPDSSRLAFGRGPDNGGDTRTVMVFDTTSWAKVDSMATPPAREVETLAYSPAGDVLAVGVDRGFGTPPYLYRYATADYSLLDDPALAPTADVVSLAYGPAVTPVVPPFWTNKIKTTEIV